MASGPAWRPAVAAMVVAIAAVSAACAGPTTDLSDYQHKAANTAESLASEVQSALLTGRLVLDRRVPLRYAATTVGRVEDDASSVQETFDSRQPPDRRAADDLRDRVDAAVQDATSAIADMRIAIRRGSDNGIRQALDELRKALPPLQRLEGIA